MSLCTDSAGNVSLSSAATHADPFTGLPMRGWLEGQFARRTFLARRTAAVAVVDLDGLAWVNQRHGHNVGDALVMWAADQVRLNTRPGVRVVRWGGDEFVVLIPHGLRARAAEVVEELRRVAPMACRSAWYVGLGEHNPVHLQPGEHVGQVVSAGHEGPGVGQARRQVEMDRIVVDQQAVDGVREPERATGRIRPEHHCHRAP